MNDFFKGIAKILLILLGIWTGAAALLSLFTSLAYTDSLLLTAILIVIASYLLYNQKKAAEDHISKQQQDVHEAVIQYAYNLMIQPGWGTNLIKPASISVVDGGYEILSNQSPIIYVRMQTINRLPLSAADKQILQNALQTDINFAIANNQIPCRKAAVWPIYTDQGAEWAKIEVTI